MTRNNDYDHVMSVDKKNVKHLWIDSIKLEIDQQHQHNTCKDICKGQPPKGCNKIRDHFVFDVKHDGMHTAILVADRHLTDVPLSRVYSGLVSLRGIMLALFLDEMNGLESWGTCEGNDFIEVFTKEKACSVAVSKFGHLEGHNLIIVSASHGLQDSGVGWHERLANFLRGVGFEPWKTQPDVWWHLCEETHYDHVVVCVDDLIIASKDLKGTSEILISKHSIELKGERKMSYHLGYDFDRDDDSTLHFCLKACRNNS